MDSLRRLNARLPSWARFPTGILSLIVGYVIVKIIDGFIGNRGDALIVAAIELAGGWSAAIVVGVFLLGLLIGFLLGRYLRRGTDRELQALLAFDEALFRMLPMLTDPEGPDRRLVKVLKTALTASAKAFGPTVHRGMVLMPTADNEWLEPVADYKMPAQTLKESRYYIGRNKQIQGRTGVARTVFLTGVTKVVCVFERNGEWVAVDPDYRRPSPADTAPSYRTFICVAIKWQDDCFGVLCMDSHTENCFNGEQARQLIGNLGTRLATAFVLHERIQAPPQMNQPVQSARADVLRRRQEAARRLNEQLREQGP